MAAGTRLAIGGCIVLGVTAYMAYVGASTSWQYYLTVDECVANAPALVGQPIRVSGVVAPGSLRIATNRTQTEFLLSGSAGELSVTCGGPLPDNLAEGKQVVVEGRLENEKLLAGHKLFTRCASKYAPSESGKDRQTPDQSG